MKGILICGGTGSRLRPLTDITNKSLLPVYDKPLIHYPLKILLDADIREIAIISGTEHIDQMADYLGSGSRFGCEFSYKVQEKPDGIAQALGLAEEFSEGQNICAILGDNVYFDAISTQAQVFTGGAHVFVKEVPDPERFGVIELSTQGPVSIEEKPENPKSNLALTGCYLFDNRCFSVIKNLQPSARGEYEVTDVLRWYLEQSELHVTTLYEEWIDAGTFESLFAAANLVREKQGM